MAFGLGYLSQLEVERLDGVGRVNQASQVSREVEERPDALPVAAPRGRDRRKALRVLGFKRVELREARLLGGRRVDVAQLGADRLSLRPTDEAHRVTNHVHDARLHDRLREHGLDGLRETLETVAAGDEDVLNASVF